MSTESTNEQPAPEHPSRLRRAIAFLVAFITVGAGHVVLGQTNRGFKWFASVIAAVALFIVAVIIGWPSLAWFFAAAAAAIRLGSIGDTLRLRKPQGGFGKWTATLISLLMLGIGQFAGDAALALIRADSQPTDSMYPTIEAGDHLITSRIFGRVGRGDLIIFDYPLDPTKRYLKRIIGVAGDTVEIRGGQVILNGKPIERMSSGQRCALYDFKCTIWRETLAGKTYRISILDDSSYVEKTSREFGPVVIPNSYVFVLGDNRDNSADSRYWGNVPVDLIRTKPKFVYWSSSQSGIRWNRINQVLD